MTFSLTRCFLLMILFSQINYAAISDHQYHHPEEWVKSIQGDKNKGEKIYHEFCESCHAKKPVIPLNAPRVGIKNDWTLRIQKGNDVLLKNLIEGIGAMPPRGGCFECSDDDLKASLSYLLLKNSEKR